MVNVDAQALAVLTAMRDATRTHENLADATRRALPDVPEQFRAEILAKLHDRRFIDGVFERNASGELSVWFVERITAAGEDIVAATESSTSNVSSGAVEQVAATMSAADARPNPQPGAVLQERAGDNNPRIGVAGLPRRLVFLVQGRDRAATEATTALLRAFDLRVVGWEEAAEATGTATPYTGDVVAKGMEMAHAVVVLLTPDDIGCVNPDFLYENDGREEREPSGQPRMNVIFEAGMAMARDRKRVILVEFGHIRPMSDTAGLNVVRFDDTHSSRRKLAMRLRTAGLDVHLDNDEWPAAGDFARVAEAQLTVDPMWTVTRARAEDDHLDETADDKRAPPRPMTNDPATALNLIKLYLPDPMRRIDLQDLVAQETDRVVTDLQELPVNLSDLDGAALEVHYERVLTAMGPLLKLIVTGVRYDLHREYSYVWADVVQRLLRIRKPFTGTFQDIPEAARHLPALFALRAAGTTSVSVSAEITLLMMLRNPLWRDWHHDNRRLPASAVLHDYRVLPSEAINSLPSWGGTKWLYPASHYLRAVLRGFLRDVLPDDDDYKWACDRYEFRVALVQHTVSNLPGAYRSAPGEFIGELQWDGDRPLAEVDFVEETERADDAWPWWSVVSRTELTDTLASLRSDLQRMRRWS